MNKSLTFNMDLYKLSIFQPWLYKNLTQIKHLIPVILTGMLYNLIKLRVEIKSGGNDMTWLKATISLMQINTVHQLFVAIHALLQAGLGLFLPASASQSHLISRHL